jgi:hypothetical protein
MFYTLNRTVEVIGAPKDQYIETNDTFKVSNTGLKDVILTRL